MIWMVAHTPRRDGATLWFGSIGSEPPAAIVRLVIEAAGGRRQVMELRPQWQLLPVGEGLDVWSCWRSIEGLSPDTRYTLRLAEADEAVIVRTLPSAMPGPGEAPLRVLLGSCFDPRGHGASMLPGLVRRLEALTPHVKLLCGDQVYVDLPVMRRLPTTDAGLRRFLLEKYRMSWAPRGAASASGYGDLLRVGANLLISDDHEFWNNFPFAAGHVPFTLDARNRASMTSLGRAFFQAFQADYAAAEGLRCRHELRVGAPDDPRALEIFAIDGRFARTTTRAHHPDDLAALVRWIDRLRGPGIIALSQPLFEPPQGNLRKKMIDAGIADFSDFDPLARALDRAPHDLLILSGDIHCGRIAAATGGASGRKIVEIVASPISLIPGTNFCDWPAFGAFPPRAVSRVSRTLKVEPLMPLVKEDHVAMIELRRVGASLRVDVAYWRSNGAPLAGRTWSGALS
jgi:hypothetical protein